MSLVYTTMLAIVPLLAFAFSVLKGLGVHRDLEPILRGFLAPLGPRAGELSGQIIGFVDNVSGSRSASIGIALLLYIAVDRWRRRSRAASTSSGASTGRAASRAASAST